AGGCPAASPPAAGNAAPPQIGGPSRPARYRVGSGPAHRSRRTHLARPEMSESRLDLALQHERAIALPEQPLGVIAADPTPMQAARLDCGLTQGRGVYELAAPAHHPAYRTLDGRPGLRVVLLEDAA